MAKQVKEIRESYVSMSCLTAALRMSKGDIMEAVLEEMAKQDKERQAIEDERANKRNRNRFYTLVFAIVLGAVVVWAFQHDWFGAWATEHLYGYSFVITVFLDMGLAAYAYVKRF